MMFRSDKQRRAMFANMNSFSTIPGGNCHNRFTLSQEEKDWVKPRMYWVDTARSNKRRVKNMKPVYVENVNKMLDEASGIYPNTIDTLKDNNVIISYDDNIGALSGRTAAMIRGNKADNEPDILYLHRDTTPISVLHEIGHINEYEAREDKGLPIPETSWNEEMVIANLPGGRGYGTQIDPVGLELTAIKFQERMRKKQAKLKDKDWALVDSEGNIRDSEFTEKEAKRFVYGSNIYNEFDDEHGVWKKIVSENVVNMMELPSNELYIVNVNEHPEMLKKENIVLDVEAYDDV